MANLWHAKCTAAGPATNQGESDLSVQARTQVLTILFWSAIFLLTAAWLEGFIEPTYMLFRRIPQGYNEGWNAYWAQVAWQGGALYPAPSDAISNNYPPLSFYIVGAFGRLIGDNIFAGRLVAEITLLMVGGSIWSWLRAAGMSRSVALFGASLFLAAFVSFGYEYVGTDDPQMLAHAMIITGVMILWRFDFSRRSIVAGGLLGTWLCTAEQTPAEPLPALPVSRRAGVAVAGGCRRGRRGTAACRGASSQVTPKPGNGRGRSIRRI